ncbi:Flp family type IVb pilin [Bradyrhizobium sp. Ce-3]|uniref:Flp family type IVb pilin n=1 Tax=Bradyrhizobium sp. Ce-3 TaxID=2913970 RepID=UPI001FC7F9D3|nr:Flp family type IVb pilin [Bradyrhizobium sp. Ce-3]
MKMLRKFLADETAATAIEYGLIAAGIAVVIISAVKGVGTKLSGTFSTISTSLK